MKDYTDVLSGIRKRWQSRMDDDGWVTIKGTHVLLEGGVAVGGGKLKGMTFSNARSTKWVKKVTTVNSRESFDKIMQARKAKNPNYNTDTSEEHEKTPTGVEDIRNQTNATKSEAMQMYNNIQRYSGFSYEAIKEASKGDREGFNNAVASGRVKSSGLTYDECVEANRVLEDFIARSPKVSGEIRRGVALTDEAYNKMMSDISKGGITSSTGLSSWTTANDIADNFSQGSLSFTHKHPVVQILRHGTTKGTSIKGVSRFGFEDEVLVSGTQKRQYTGKYWTDKASGITYVEVDEIM